MFDSILNFLIFIFGICFIIAGCYKDFVTEKIKKRGNKIRANIVDFKVEISYNNDYNKKLYFPIIQFIDKSGNSRKIIYDIGTTSKPKTLLPKKIEIYYLDNEGIISIIIIDDKLTEYLPVLFIFMGFLMTIFSIYTYFV